MLPRTRGYSDLDRARGGPAPERERAWRAVQRPVRQVAAAPVGDGAHRPIEAHPHRRPQRNRQPALAHVRDGGAQRPPLVALVPERPAQPARPANQDVHRHPLAWRQPRPWRQAPAAHRKRNPPSVGPERAHALERPAERLHVHPRERRRVIGQPHARPRQHGSDQPKQGDHDDREAPPGTPARAPRRRQIARAHEGRGRRFDRHAQSIRT
jgi:hypothetical protein